MKKNKLTLAILAVFAFVLVTMQSCKKEELNASDNTPITKEYNNRSGSTYSFGLGSDTIADVMPPILTCDLPIFPFEVLYVVCKEYESVEDGTSSKSTYNNRQILSYTKSEYAESRLIDLYPDKAYVGIVEDSQDFYDSVINVYNSYPYLEESTGYGINGVDLPDEELEYVSYENETVVLNMTVNETSILESMNNLARMGSFATLNEILNASGKTQTLSEKFDSVTFGMIAVMVGSYIYQRALLCAQRAETKALSYYGESDGNGVIIVKSGTDGDAFKHVFVNVMLRRYLTQPLAYLIMDVYYENANQNYPCDKYMDWHNNYVGRKTKYSTFRVGNNWETWGVNVRTYINNSSNAVYKNWTTTTPKRTVKNEEKKVDDKKYIYIGY
ncbi:MAG: hypothetical protein IJZ87_07610 [Bacteroidales bacterium]|nr:hypothetical protein [Bacteroidales bacterium]